MIVFSFLSVPQIASSYDIFKKVNTTSAPSTVSNNTGNGTSSGNGTFAKLVGEICPAATTQTSRTAAEHILDFFTGQVCFLFLVSINVLFNRTNICLMSFDICHLSNIAESHHQDWFLSLIKS